MPFFSVIMACYNSEKHIAKSIQSVLGQTEDDWEMIIVDDASTDNTLKIAKKFQDSDSRIKVVGLEQNQGPGYARNFSVQQAKGNWLAILDADDIFLPNKLELQKRKIIDCDNTDLVLIGSDTYHITDGEGQRLKKFTYPTDSKSLKENLLLRKKFPPHSSIAYKTEAFRESGGFNSNFLRAQDYDFWLRLSKVGDFLSISTPLIEYRLHNGQITVNQSSQGYLQVEYSYVAQVCNILRQENESDPSQSVEQFNELISFVSKNYRKSYYPKSTLFLEKLKHSLQKRTFSKILLLIFSSPIVTLHFLFERMGVLSFEKYIFKLWKTQN